MLSAKMNSQVLELRDGSAVIIRPIQPDDADNLTAMHERLSKHSKILRYLAAPKRLPQNDIYQICQVDYRNDMALVVTTISASEKVVAMAAYAATDEGPDVAEITIVVEDAWQGRGLGTKLLEHLGVYAVEHGVHFFTAYVHRENNQILKLVVRSGLPYTRELTHGLWKIRICLPPPEKVDIITHIHWEAPTPSGMN